MPCMLYARCCAPRRSTSGRSMPVWLLDSKSALLKKHVRDSKTDLLVEVRLLEVNPTYAYVRFPDGRESSVSTRHLAPTGSGDAEEAQQEVTAGDDCSENCEPLHQENEEKTTLRRSQRIRRPPQRLDLDVSLEGGTAPDLNCGDHQTRCQAGGAGASTPQ
ncbi:Isoleucine--tRNA ligase [Trichinella spiralis]|uniref:Isoleucine--tRNA ligase n=1 Tax=Trichinella spiralis TaxID=6334 RepID=A0ABR3KEG8_TRISP